MRKEAWTYALAGTVPGGFGLFLRWLQCQIIFDETGLPARNAPVSWLLVIYLAAMVAALWWLSGRYTPGEVPLEPEEAFACTTGQTGLFLGMGAVAVGLGAALMFLRGESMILRIIALLGILSAPVIGMFPSLPRWGGFGAGLGLIPAVFFSLWLVMFYKVNAVNPLLWQYAMEILAIAGCLLAVYRAAGCLYYRYDPRKCIFSCALAAALSLMVLMDDISMGERVMFAGWAICFGVLCWILVAGFYPDKMEENPEENKENQE